MAEEFDAPELLQQERMVALVKGALGQIPFLGNILAEIFGQIIPDLRRERVEKYLRELARRLDRLEETWLNSMGKRQAFVRLVERGALASAEAISDFEIERIAELVSRGFGEEDVHALRQERLLKLLQRIDDEQYLMLVEEAKFHIQDDRKFTHVKRPDLVYAADGWDKVANSALFDSGREELFRLGLLTRKLKHGAEGARLNFSRDDFDYSERISRIGLLLLRETGFPELHRP